MSVANTTPKTNIFIRMHPVQRVLISIVLSAITYLFVRQCQLGMLMLFMLLWDVFALSFITTSWIVFFTRTTPQIRQYARKDDGSRTFVTLTILAASLASMLMILLLIRSEISQDAQSMYLPVAIGGVLLSWVMIHSMLTFHYAHMYYDDDVHDPNKHAEGLEFPHEAYPDYLDFAYFAFVIGMTFQVSDVQITSRIIRRTALVHGLLSFALNTFVVALTVNFIAGLKK